MDEYLFLKGKVQDTRSASLAGVGHVHSDTGWFFLRG